MANWNDQIAQYWAMKTYNHTNSCISLWFHAVHVGQCYILKDNPQAIATPSYRNQTVSSNGCVGDSDSNIHVLAMTFEPSELSKFGFSDDRLRPNVTVRVTSHLGQQEKRPIVLVVASATPVQLTVIIDRGVTLETILWVCLLFACTRVETYFWGSHSWQSLRLKWNSTLKNIAGRFHS